MGNQLGKPHVGLPERRGSTPQDFTAVRAAGTSGVSPPLVEEVTATSTYHKQNTAWQPQRGAGICYQHRVAPRFFTHLEILAW